MHVLSGIEATLAAFNASRVRSDRPPDCGAFGMFTELDGAVGLGSPEFAGVCFGDGVAFGVGVTLAGLILGVGLAFGVGFGEAAATGPALPARSKAPMPTSARLRMDRDMEVRVRSFMCLIPRSVVVAFFVIGLPRLRWVDTDQRQHAAAGGTVGRDLEESVAVRELVVLAAGVPLCLAGVKG